MIARSSTLVRVAAMGLAIASLAAQDRGADDVEPLRAFAKLYGYVKYFHPSDEAAAIDWTRFAIHGAEVVARTTTRGELVAAMRRLFTPICPTLELGADRVVRSGEPPRGGPAPTRRVFWQHLGDGLDVPPDERGSSVYRSRRVNRADEATGSAFERARGPGPVYRLFEAEPDAGETIDKPLAPGLWCRLPLAVDADEAHTYPRAEAAELDALQHALRAVDLEAATADRAAVRVAGVVIAWNAFQHFYPYFDVVATDWDARLTDALREARADRTPGELRTTLRRLLAGLRDGHVNVRHALTSTLAGLPFRVGDVDGQVVVTDPGEEPAVQAGDIVRTVDGVDAMAMVEASQRLHSGSDQRTRAMALFTFGLGEESREAALGLDRSGAALAVRVRRGPHRPRAPARLPIDHLTASSGASVMYVDLSRATQAAIDARLTELAAAEVVIFDLRGYPRGNHEVLRHLIDRPVRSAQWRIPRVLRPDRERSAGVEVGHWTLEPRAPRFAGRAVFITNALAISYAESLLGIVEHYALGEIVGGPTAGANGNVHRLQLPGGYTVAWTGMQVLKQDGGQHHLVGIRPTVPAEPTLAGVRAGRDELLETAMEVGQRRRLAPLVR